jgi:DNA-binding CsgD family transcriptional regulator
LSPTVIRTNREVAEILFVSASTVSAGLAWIYRKLGVSSRTEMAARLGAWGVLGLIPPINVFE